MIGTLSSISRWFCSTELPAESMALRWTLASLLACLQLPVALENLQFEFDDECAFLATCAEVARLEASAFHTDDTLLQLQHHRVKLLAQGETLWVGNLSSFKAFLPNSPVFRIFIAVVLTQLEWIQETGFMAIDWESRHLFVAESPLYSLPQLLQHGQL